MRTNRTLLIICRQKLNINGCLRYPLELDYFKARSDYFSLFSKLFPSVCDLYDDLHSSWADCKVTPRWNFLLAVIGFGKSRI